MCVAAFLQCGDALCRLEGGRGVRGAAAAVLQSQPHRFHQSARGQFHFAPSSFGLTQSSSLCLLLIFACSIFFLPELSSLCANLPHNPLS